MPSSSHGLTPVPITGSFIFNSNLLTLILLNYKKETKRFWPWYKSTTKFNETVTHSSTKCKKSKLWARQSYQLKITLINLKTSTHTILSRNWNCHMNSVCMSWFTSTTVWKELGEWWTSMRNRGCLTFWTKSLMLDNRRKWSKNIWSG